MSGILTKRELAALMMVRVSKPPSRALPKQCYMDPAVSIQFEREKAMSQAKKALARERNNFQNKL